VSQALWVLGGPNHWRALILSWTLQKWRGILIPRCKSIRGKHQQKNFHHSKMNAIWPLFLSFLLFSFFFPPYGAASCNQESGDFQWLQKKHLVRKGVTLFKMLLNAFRETPIPLGCFCGRKKTCDIPVSSAAVALWQTQLLQWGQLSWEGLQPHCSLLWFLTSCCPHPNWLVRKASWQKMCGTLQANHGKDSSNNLTK